MESQSDKGMDGADPTRANVEGAGLTPFRNVPMTEEQRDRSRVDVAEDFGRLESSISTCHASNTFAGSNF